ncbi:hypothetical protein Adt_11419 [Abeliophyllum distichum]|uniref:Uncharacterized protein n=1 Tax=Abeliophyllum distichum TaxID=126358 RepID=A0ABD1UMT2_9LAMI
MRYRAHLVRLSFNQDHPSKVRPSQTLYRSFTEGPVMPMDVEELLMMPEGYHLNCAMSAGFSLKLGMSLFNEVVKILHFGGRMSGFPIRDKNGCLFLLFVEPEHTGILLQSTGVGWFFSVGDGWWATADLETEMDAITELGGVGLV